MDLFNHQAGFGGFGQRVLHNEHDSIPSASTASVPPPAAANANGPTSFAAHTRTPAFPPYYPTYSQTSGAFPPYHHQGASMEVDVQPMNFGGGGFELGFGGGFMGFGASMGFGGDYSGYSHPTLNSLGHSVCGFCALIPYR